MKHLSPTDPGNWHSGALEPSEIARPHDGPPWMRLTLAWMLEVPGAVSQFPQRAKPMSTLEAPWVFGELLDDALEEEVRPCRAALA